jgi:serine/threonine protein kinase
MRKLLLIVVLLIMINKSISLCEKAIHRFPKYSCVRSKRFSAGASGTAYLVELDGKRYILKSQKTSKGSKNELKILQKMKGLPFIVQLEEHIVTKKRTFFIINFGSKGNLETFLSRHSTLNFNFAVHLFNKIMRGVDEMHKAGFVHADLKLSNVVVDDHNNPIIIDFDLSVEIDTMSSPKGTFDYMAPEVMKNFIQTKPVLYTPQIDLYSISVMFYEIFTRVKPYIINPIDYNALMKKEIMFKKNQPLDFYTFVSQTLMTASHRASYKKAHEFLRKINLKNIDVLSDDHSYN